MILPNSNLSLPRASSMSDLVRFSVSLESELLERFDRFCDAGRFATRSEGIRQLLHRALVDEAWDENAGEALATLTIVYDHHRPGLVANLLEAQHAHAGLVVSSLHVHLDHAHCLEVIVLKGSATDLRAMAARLRGLKGIRCGDLAVAHVPGINGESPGHDHHSH